MPRGLTSILYVRALYPQNLARGLRKKPEGRVTLLLHPLRVVRTAVLVSRQASRGCDHRARWQK
jgi:hypothetical protein